MEWLSPVFITTTSFQVRFINCNTTPFNLLKEFKCLHLRSFNLLAGFLPQYWILWNLHIYISSKFFEYQIILTFFAFCLWVSWRLLVLVCKNRDNNFNICCHFSKFMSRCPTLNIDSNEGELYFLLGFQPYKKSCVEKYNKNYFKKMYFYLLWQNHMLHQKKFTKKGFLRDIVLQVLFVYHVHDSINFKEFETLY